ncbi:MAG: serine/threonine-protein kinase, partial [Clostridia bacterium]|nr:serine/threonine-protein kinase [Clostridia bacterium]
MTDRIIANRYRVMELIGSGGMAHVYKAKDIIAGRIVAIKVLKEENKDDLEFVRRFEREAQAVLSLSHPNIVSSYDVGVDDDMHFLVLEYVEGRTLKEIITEEKTLSPKQTINIACQVLDALSHAHERGIIHRDVKPQNVIITPRGKVKLTDFGIARDTASTTRTFAGSNMIGSVHFLSPEQARGEEVTAESDIYSCGIMLYEMLTGTVPFSGDNTVAIALKHLQEDITPPVRVNSKIPSSLSDIIVKAASKRPEDRYESASAMKADLQRSLREPHGKFARKKTAQETETEKKNAFAKLKVGTIAFVVLLVLGLLIMLLFVTTSLLGSSTSRPQFTVPLFVGKTLDEAMQLAESNGYVLSPQYEPNADSPKGEVIFQVPSKGTKLAEGGTV